MIEGQALMTFDKQMRLGSKEHQSSAAMKENGDVELLVRMINPVDISNNTHLNVSQKMF